MTTYVTRQLSSFLADGEFTQMSEATVFPWRAIDVKPSTKLVIEDGKYDSGHIHIPINSSYALPLPNAYEDTQRLFVYIKSDNPVKVTVIRPDTSSEIFILQGNSSNNAGILCFQMHLGSIRFSLPNTASVAANVDYVMYEMPSDLLDPLAYRDTYRTIGYV